MEYSHVKKCVDEAFKGVAEDVLALLFWRGQELSFKQGDKIYAEGTVSDGTISILLAGELSFLKEGAVIGTTSDPVCFVEIVFYGAQKKRTATVQVSSKGATTLRLQIDQKELTSGVLSELGKLLA